MRRVCMNSNGTSAKGLAELNHHVRNEQKEARDGVTGGGQGLSDEEESRINNGVDVNPVRKDLVQQPVAVQQRSVQQPQGPQGSVVHWERFLPIGTLKVLLVEFDDSTRHVVSALLRNCSYEVTAVANGIEAWKILGDLTNHIDLVLTEVAMPYLSGIGLLNKIMNHKTCKNIPVIMMSSNDSMGIVFKCLSRGAVDFLVKPIRKNELKNLWQHVWRKCQSSSGSGSGSESGIRTQKSSKSKSVEGAGNNNSVGNDEDDIASISLNDKNGSDTGSGTQSSWTKRAVEVDSPQPMSPWDELTDVPDSTCAQVIHLRPEAFSNNWVPTTGARNEHGDITMGKDLQIGVPRNSDLQMEDQSKKLPLAVTGSQRKNLESENGAKLEKDKMQLTGVTSNDKSKEVVVDLMGMINCDNPQIDNIATELPGDISKTNIKDEGRHDPKRIPSLGLSLKRLRDDGDVEDTAQEQNVLRRSNLSAFSRYNTISTANQTPTGNVGSCSPHNNSSEAEKTRNIESNSNGTPNQRSNGSSNNNDMGSTTNNTFVKSAITDKPVSKTTVNIHPCSAFQPVRNSSTTPLQPLTPSKGDATAVDTVLAQASGISSQVQVQHHHHHYHHHHHHVHNTTKKLPNNDDVALRTMPCPNALNTPVEGNAANYDMNGSASGSNSGSNGQSGNSTAVITEGTNIGSENGLAGNCGAGADAGSGNGSRSNALREAALNKFRQKRKERCFEKKVRYQSRKKLAEQRPRVRGQFVRQGDNKSKETDS